MKVKAMIINVGIMLTVTSCSTSLDANLNATLPTSADPQNPDKFFSLVEIKNAAKVPMPPLQYIPATDEISLAYRSYLPQQAQAILIFYHGAGAHSGLSYNHIGSGLRDDFNIAVYMPDIRGHGGSEGERGDAPNTEQVWSDINTIIGVARDKYPDSPLFIGGHSSGAGLVLNYSSWQQKVNVDGYVFLSPYFGFRSETNFDEGDNNHFEFAKVNTTDFVINTISGGLLLGHAKAVKFNFPAEVLRDNPEIVPFNTVNMSKAVTPHSPDTQLAAVQQFGLWIGKQDEAFDPIKVSRFAQKHSNEKASTDIEIVKNENHFSIMLNAASFIGPWLTNAIK